MRLSKYISEYVTLEYKIATPENPRLFEVRHMPDVHMENLRVFKYERTQNAMYTCKM